MSSCSVLIYFFWLRIAYASELVVGPNQLRPWQLGFRADFSYSSFAEPDDTQMLMEVILSEGLRPKSHRFKAKIVDS